MTDKQIKSLLIKAGAIQTALTIIFGIVMWVFKIGQASADVVHQSDLVTIRQDIAHVREDVSYIRGRIDNSPKGVIVSP